MILELFETNKTFPFRYDNSLKQVPRQFLGREKKVEKKEKESPVSLDGLIYRPVWVESDTEEFSESPPEGKNLIFSDNHGFGDQLAQRLGAERCILIRQISTRIEQQEDYEKIIREAGPIHSISEEM